MTDNNTERSGSSQGRGGNNTQQEPQVSNTVKTNIPPQVELEPEVVEPMAVDADTPPQSNLSADENANYDLEEKDETIFVAENDCLNDYHNQLHRTLSDTPGNKENIEIKPESKRS